MKVMIDAPLGFVHFLFSFKGTHPRLKEGAIGWFSLLALLKNSSCLITHSRSLWKTSNTSPYWTWIGVVERLRCTTMSNQIIILFKRAVEFHMLKTKGHI
jgi:hypothetical protein